eukprot:171753-Rhodomonas_salina.2
MLVQAGAGVRAGLAWDPGRGCRTALARLQNRQGGHARGQWHVGPGHVAHARDRQRVVVRSGGGGGARGGRSALHGAVQAGRGRSVAVLGEGEGGGGV